MVSRPGDLTVMCRAHRRGTRRGEQLWQSSIADRRRGCLRRAVIAAGTERHPRSPTPHPPEQRCRLVTNLTDPPAAVRRPPRGRYPSTITAHRPGHMATSTRARSALGATGATRVASGAQLLWVKINNRRLSGMVRWSRRWVASAMPYEGRNAVNHRRKRFAERGHRIDKDWPEPMISTTLLRSTSPGPRCAAHP